MARVPGVLVSLFTTAALLVGGWTSLFSLMPRSATVPNDLASRASRVVDLNNYAPVTRAATDGIVDGATLTSASTMFTRDSVGETVLIRGAGVAGVAFQTIIAGYIGPNSVTLAAPAFRAAKGLTFYHGIDATQGVARAFLRAQAIGAAVKGSGAFWLASQSVSMSLSGLSIAGEGGPTAGFAPYISGGLTFLVTQTGVAPFDPGVGAHFAASMLWPAQDGSAVSPIAYPAAFEVPAGGLITNFTISGATLINPFRLLSIEPGGGGGRIFIANTRAFCIDRCFDVRNGLADTIQTDATDYFGPGVYGDIAPTGNAYLQKYAASNGEVFHLDPNATGSNYPNIDGLLVNGGIFQGMRYAIRLVSGLLDVSQISALDLDSVATALSVEGTAKASLSWTGGLIYATQSYTPDATNDVFSISDHRATGGSDLVVSGVNIPFAQGNVVHDFGFGLHSLTFVGNYASNWGSTTDTGRTFYAVNMPNNPAAVTIASSTLECVASPGNASSGILLGGSLAASITGSVFVNCDAPVTLIGAAGAYAVTGNTTVGTTGAKSVVNKTSGATVVVSANANNLDKP